MEIVAVPVDSTLVLAKTLRPSLKAPTPPATAVMTIAPDDELTFEAVFWSSRSTMPLLLSLLAAPPEPEIVMDEPPRVFSDRTEPPAFAPMPIRSTPALIAPVAALPPVPVMLIAPVPVAEETMLELPSSQTPELRLLPAPPPPVPMTVMPPAPVIWTVLEP